MNLIPRCAWLPSGQDRAILPARDFSLGPARSKVVFFGDSSHIINPLLTKLVRPRWLDIALVLVLRVYEILISSRSINTQKKNLANIQPSWPHTWSITIFLIGHQSVDYVQRPGIINLAWYLPNTCKKHLSIRRA